MSENHSPEYLYLYIQIKLKKLDQTREMQKMLQQLNVEQKHIRQRLFHLPHMYRMNWLKDQGTWNMSLKNKK